MREAIAFHLERLGLEGHKIPQPSTSINLHRGYGLVTLCAKRAIALAFTTLAQEDRTQITSCETITLLHPKPQTMRSLVPSTGSAGS
jgi:hypothetical protein